MAALCCSKGKPQIGSKEPRWLQTAAADIVVQDRKAIVAELAAGGCTLCFVHPVDIAVASANRGETRADTVTKHLEYVACTAVGLERIRSFQAPGLRLRL